ncbi:MAG: tetratricopeptide repeat protein [Spiribacter salinus]|uniref:Tetratricopeptide repeat protein n=1 Tax=Spiribacter salinus TaxID=1335746 RepID=A0A540VNT0_9GAMM|nr:MAG: tetratricopeptide repeat protein [Spiribacter salinus]
MSTIQTPRYSIFFCFAAALAVAVFSIYLPGLSGGFIFDDYPNIVRNSDLAIDQITPSALATLVFDNASGPLNRPIAYITFAIERYLVGLDPSVMKTTNVVIHFINSLLVFGLLRRLLAWRTLKFNAAFVIPNQWFAFLIALAWAVAPINLTSVLYIVQRMESLSTLVMLAGLLGYVHGRVRLARGSPNALRWLWASIGFGLAIGVLVKESAVMLPVYALVIEAVFFRFGAAGSGERQAVLRLYAALLAAPAVLGAIWIAPRILGADAFGNRDFTLSERLWTQARVLWHYMAWTLIPNTGSLSLYHHGFPISHGPLTPWTTMPAAVGLGALGYSAWAVRRLAPWIAFGVLWFFVMHLLVSTVVALELVHEHRNYMGSLGLITALFALVLDRRIIDLRTIRVAALAAVIALFAVVTSLRSYQWGDPVRHMLTEVQEQPDNDRARFGLAKQLLRYSEGPESPAFRQATEALRDLTGPDAYSIAPWQVLILSHAKNGLSIPDEWWQEARQHLASNVVSATDRQAIFLMVEAQISGKVQLNERRLEAWLEQAVAQRPHDQQLLRSKANFLVNVKRDMEAGGAVLRRSTVMSPNSPTAWRELIRYQIAVDRDDNAEASLERLGELNPLGMQTPFIETQRARLAGSGERP